MKNKLTKAIKGSFEAMAIFWLALTHQVGLCKHWHRSKDDLVDSTLSVCPIIDRIMFYLYPLIEVND